MPTDTVAAQRALEIGVEALLLAKSGVDGVYSADPRKDKSATKYESVSYDEVLSKSLAVADAAAFALCRENKLPIVIFDDDPVSGLYTCLTYRAGTDSGA